MLNISKTSIDKADHNERILVVSDLHIPYHHPDSFAFLKAIKKKFKPTRVINIGDEVDNHGISFHDSDPDLLSPGDELLESQKYCAELEKIFPEMDLVHSNHGSLSFRKMKAKGLPIHLLKPYNEILQVGDGWEWHPEILVEINGASILFRHQFKKNILQATRQMGVCCVQGHFHTTFEIAYNSSPLSLNWGMTVGCLIDKHSMAFEYNKLHVDRPILGCGIISNGQPALIPMYLDGEGNWTGEL